MRCALSSTRPDVISVISIQEGKIIEFHIQKISIEWKGGNCCFRKIIIRKGIMLYEVFYVLVCRLRNLVSELQLKYVKGKMIFLQQFEEKTVILLAYLIDALERLLLDNHVQDNSCLHTFSWCRIILSSPKTLKIETYCVVKIFMIFQILIIEMITPKR